MGWLSTVVLGYNFESRMYQTGVNPRASRDKVRVPRWTGQFGQVQRALLHAAYSLSGAAKYETQESSDSDPLFPIITKSGARTHGQSDASSHHAQSLVSETAMETAVSSAEGNAVVPVSTINNVNVDGGVSPTTHAR